MTSMDRAARRRPKGVRSIEDIRQFFDSRFCLPVGSGTSGLYLVLAALNASGGKVLVPERTCFNVVAAVLAAGARPVPVRVDSRNYNLAPDSIDRSVDTSVKAVLAVSSFGYPADIQGIRQAVGAYGIPIIDDACQAYGGEVDGVKVGHRGDVGVVSFGYAKPVDTKGGGMIITDSEELSGRIIELTKLAPSDLESRFKNFVLRTLMRTGQVRATNYLARATSLLSYAMPASSMKKLHAVWPGFVDAIPRIRQNLRRVDEILRDKELVIPFDYDWSLQWLPWRYSFKTPSRSARNEVRAILKSHGVPTSTLYGSVIDYCGIQDSSFADDPDRGLDNVINLRYAMTVGETDMLVRRLESAANHLDRR